MVSQYPFLGVPVPIRFIGTHISAADLAFHVVHHVGGQRGVVDVQIRYNVIAFPADVLGVAANVGAEILRRHALRGMPVRHRAALEAGQRRR